VTVYGEAAVLRQTFLAHGPGLVFRRHFRSNVSS